MQYIVIWDNVAFHRSALVQNWFNQHRQFTVQYITPYSSFLNPIEEFFSAWRWKVYDLRPYVQMALIQAMEEACDQIEAASIQGWIRHSKRFFPRCLANSNIACDVDEALWPDPARQMFFYVYLICYSIAVLHTLYFFTIFYILLSLTWNDIQCVQLKSTCYKHSITADRQGK